MAIYNNRQEISFNGQRGVSLSSIFLGVLLGLVLLVVMALLWSLANNEEFALSPSPTASPSNRAIVVIPPTQTPPATTEPTPTPTWVTSTAIPSPPGEQAPQPASSTPAPNPPGNNPPSESTATFEPTFTPSPQPTATAAGGWASATPAFPTAEPVPATATIGQRRGGTVSPTPAPAATEVSYAFPTAAPSWPTNTPYVPTNTPFVPTNTPFVPTNTPFVPTNTPFVPTNTPFVPTYTPYVPTNTPYVPTNTPYVPTHTPFVPTKTPVPARNVIITSSSPSANSTYHTNEVQFSVQVYGMRDGDHLQLWTGLDQSVPFQEALQFSRNGNTYSANMNYQPGNAGFDREYYWRVDVIAADGTVFSSEVRKFRWEDPNRVQGQKMAQICISGPSTSLLAPKAKSCIFFN